MCQASSSFGWSAAEVSTFVPVLLFWIQAEWALSSHPYCRIENGNVRL